MNEPVPAAGAAVADDATALAAGPALCRTGRWPLAALPLDITVWTQTDVDTGVALSTELGSSMSAAGRCTTPRFWNAARSGWIGDAP
ncbi:hypothetical protein [Streptomyces sp. DH-12]|uniref:hypothetical protein n=1 Tax=Streptomyces sp. DH-12 TaxID=2072509 RepID=UPI0018E453E6|nr:hypothetical protein [Streptomyces sp. DH-12]